MSSRINIGVRHVLPLYAGLAVIAGVGAATLLRDSSGRWAWLRPAMLFALFGWQVVSGALAHPDYLSYTNEITRGRPENFVAESDLDWGQDMHRVGDFLKKAGATEVTFTPYNVTYAEAGHAFPKVTYSDWYHASPGWNVVSLSGWKVYNHPGLDRQPAAPVPHRADSLGVVFQAGRRALGATVTVACHANITRRRPSDSL